jgi:hypothetical protein
MAEGSFAYRGTLPFLVSTTVDDELSTKGFFRSGDGEAVLREIPIDALKRSLLSCTAALRSVFEEVAAQAGSLGLQEVHVGFEVSATGGIQLIGTSQVGSKGAITLVFRNEK